MPQDPEAPQKNARRALKPSTIRIGKRYRQSRLDGSYDAIVIGSGIGGLTTAASLSAMGKKVIVLEQHYTAGGFTHAYSRNGYEWDVGVHYIGDVGYPTMSRKLFDFISSGNLKWAAMDEIYDRIILGDASYDFIAGKENFAKEMKRRFPGDAKAIDKYMIMVREVNKGMRWFTLSKLMRPWQQKLFAKVGKKLFPDYFNKTTYDVLKSITDNEALIAVLTGQWGDNGMSPKKGSFIIHCLIAKHYFNGGYYPVGGASEIATTIIPKIQAGGGEVFTYADVEQIIIENGRAVGVRMRADGSEIRAPIVVSNAGVFNTFAKLLPQELSAKHGYLNNLKKVKRSFTNVGLFIGLKGDAKFLQLPKTNLWIYPDGNHHENIDNFMADHTKPFPVVYVSFPSAKDPSFQSRYPGRSTIEIVAPASFNAWAKWKGTVWGKRGEDYEAFREYFADRMLEALYQQMPHLRGKIDYYEASTPLSTDFFCYYDEGEIYGLDHDPLRFEQHWLQPKTSIPGLWLTGQDVLSCGVAGAMISGFLTAVQILGLKGALLAKKALFDAPEQKGDLLVQHP
ncbi:MAG: FAD-dependent oxidoreductase [Gammaproteobacteria bacterium]|nr:MAG: FAD-dependent oxidoreductase [Gammaproteobacteria bacterium]